MPAQTKPDTQPLPTICQWHATEIDNMKKVLYGNGQEGLLKTVNTIEITTMGIEEKLDALIVAIKSIEEKVASVTQSVNTHHNDPLLHSAKGLLFTNLGWFARGVVALAILGLSIAGFDGIVNFLKWLASIL